MPRTLTFSLVLGLPFLTACSLSIDADRVQCKETADCRALGQAFSDTVCINQICRADPKWACLDDPEPIVSEGTGPFEVKLPLIVLNAPAPNNKLPGASVKVCTRLDGDCLNPLDTLESDEDGILNLTLNANFSGYLEVQKQGFTTTLYFFNPPITRSQTLANLSLSPTQLREGIVGLLQASPERGDILVQALDCTGKQAPGVRLELGEGKTSQAEAIQYYLEDNTPARGRDETDVTGYGGFLNVNPGQVVLNAKVAENGRQ
ncbi:MAG TPA: hypothetical protein VFQ61_27505, partial [Polyangiaceae bacterium]|nr:hypothetical protein [Polyangiaceae bacterium]